MRGFKFAALAGVIGFAVPVVVMAAATAARWAILASNEADRAYDLAWLPTNLAGAAIAFTFVFAGAGLATYAPNRTYRFLRTLGIVVLISIPSWWALAACGMAHTRYKGIEHPIIYPSEVLMLAIPPLVIACALGTLRSRRNVPQPREQVD